MGHTGLGRRFSIRGRVFASLGFILGISAPVWGQPASFEWEEQPALPAPISGQFAGVHDGTLFVAGGSSFPTSPWQGGEKQWHGEVLVLEPGSDAWREAGQIAPAAYGASFSTDNGVIVAGGTDGATVFSRVVRLSLAAGELEVEDLPALPEPVAYGDGAQLGSRIYVVGGQSTVDAVEASNRVWVMDVAAPEPAWESLDPLPRGRILPVAAGVGDALFVFSGAGLDADGDGDPVRTYLTDGFRWNENKGWTPVAGPPRPLVAAPAAPLGTGHLAVFGGDDGRLYEQTAELGDDHPGFTSEILGYHGITDTWTTLGETPLPVVTTTAIVNDDRFIIPGGEDRPGHRDARVFEATLTPERAGLVAVNLAVIALYLSALVGMGMYFARREGTTEDFFLAGHRVPWWAMGISIFGTQLSAITYLAIPARAYATDWVYVWANVGIVLIAPVIVYFILPHYRGQPFTTAFEYLEHRFNIAVRIYGALVFLLFQAGRVGIVLFLPAIALHQVTGVNVYACILAMGVLATLYTYLGGIEAVIWTDVLQVIVLSGGALIGLGILVTGVDGGIGTIVSEAANADKFHMFNWTWDMTVAAVWICVIGNTLAVMYPYAADQTLVQRYLASTDEAAAKRAVWTNAFLAIPATLVFFFLGTALYVFYSHNPEALDPYQPNDAIFAHFIVEEMPVGISGIVIAAIFAAAMSSLDSSLNSASTVLVNDFYRRFRAGLTDKQYFHVARGLTLFLGAIGTLSAIWIAARDVQSIFQEYNRILGLTGGGLAGVVAMGMWTQRTSGAGALIGAIVSAGAVYAVSTYTEVHLFLYAAVGFCTAFGVGWTMSWIIPRREAE